MKLSIDPRCLSLIESLRNLKFEKDVFVLTKEEVQALMEWLQHEFINPRLEVVNQIVNRMQEFLK